MNPHLLNLIKLSLLLPSEERDLILTLASDGSEDPGLERNKIFPGRLRLIPGKWDPEGEEEEGEEESNPEEENLETKHFGATPNDLASLALDLSSYNTPSSYHHPKESLEDIGRKYGFKISLLGSGAYRKAFSIGNDLVIKISKSWGGEDGAQMNSDDYRLGTDAEIGGIFPRAYAKDPYGRGFKWVILERVKEISHRYELAHFFKCSILVDPASLSDTDAEDYWYLVRRGFDENDNETIPWPLNRLLRSPGPFTMRDLRNDLAARSPTFKNLRLAIRKYNISVGEIRPDNLGIGSDGRLVLLDSSIF
jgi:hypothetical protein